VVRRAVDAANDLKIFEWKFERGCLKPDITWRIAQDKTEIDMYKVTVSIQENVAVVSILNLQ